MKECVEYPHNQSQWPRDETQPAAAPKRQWCKAQQQKYSGNQDSKPNGKSECGYGEERQPCANGVHARIVCRQEVVSSLVRDVNRQR